MGYNMDEKAQQIVKLNSRIEFPARLELDWLTAGTGTYVLHSVVVHRGSRLSGHYWAYIRPCLSSWFEFNDELVLPCSDEAAMENSCEADDETLKTPSSVQ